jgi:hypothetical protein
MSYNGSGVFSINSAGQPVVTGTTISSSTFNALTADLATGLTTALTKDGQSTPTANINMGSFKITGLANGTLATDAAAFGQITSRFNVDGYTTTVTAAGTTTLTVASTFEQFFTGATTQTVLLPVTSTLVLGNQYEITNMSTGVVTVNSSGGNLVVAIVPLSRVTVTVILTSGTTAASWDIQYTGNSAVTGTGSNVLAISPALTTPTLGVATATTINKVALTAPASGSTLTIADGKTLTANASLTLAGTDAKTLTVSNSLTLAGTDAKTLTVSNSLALAGTDSTVMTFPASSTTVAGLSIAETFSAAQRASYSALTDGTTITPDFSLANNYSVTLGGNRTLGVPTSIVAGQSGQFDILQDSTGSRTLAYAWVWNFAGGTAPTLTTAGCSFDSLFYAVNYFTTSTVTITIATPGVVTWTAHGLKTGNRLQLTTTGALPTGLTASVTYWVVLIDANSFSLATSLVNAAAATRITTSGTQSGTHTAVACQITASAVKAIA